MPTFSRWAPASSILTSRFGSSINGWLRNLPAAAMSAAWKRSWPLKKKRTLQERPEVTDEALLMHHLWSKGDYEISTDPARIDAVTVHEFLTNSYWAKGIPLETVRLSIEN